MAMPGGRESVSVVWYQAQITQIKVSVSRHTQPLQAFYILGKTFTLLTEIKSLPCSLSIRRVLWAGLWHDHFSAGSCSFPTVIDIGTTAINQIAEQQNDCQGKTQESNILSVS